MPYKTGCFQFMHGMIILCQQVKQECIVCSGKNLPVLISSVNQRSNATIFFFFKFVHKTHKLYKTLNSAVTCYNIAVSLCKLLIIMYLTCCWTYIS